jgi:hypothetical protein
LRTSKRLTSSHDGQRVKRAVMSWLWVPDNG